MSDDNLKRAADPSRHSTYDAMRAFIAAWWQSESIHEVCSKTGMERRDASNLAAGLRKRGIPMKSMKLVVKGKKMCFLTEADYKRLKVHAVELQERAERLAAIEREAAEIQRKYRTVT